MLLQPAPMPRLTKHAAVRLDSRRISPGAVDAVLTYGRSAHVRGALVFAIGRREVEHWRARGLDLRPFEGIQVVQSLEGRILTAYRNHDFRGLRS